MLLTLKSVSMYTVMRREKFFYRITFFADEKTMILTRFATLTSTPFPEGGNMVDELLFF
jgi:hypothetical protein